MATHLHLEMYHPVERSSQAVLLGRRNGSSSKEASDLTQKTVSGPMSRLEVPETWEVLQQEVASGPHHVLVIGGTDVGKTTFCHWLAERLAARGRETWLIDADIGQSRIGPPATVGCARIASPAPRTEMAFFVGDVSPGRTMADCLGGFAAAFRAAVDAGAGTVVVDTTGWIAGPDAVALKLAKARIIGAGHIVLLERIEELRAFRRAWRSLPGFPVHELRPAGAVVARSQGERRAFREAAFRAALKGAMECEIDLRTTAISGAHTLAARLPRLPSGLLIGLSDPWGKLLSLGMLRSLGSVAGRMTCLCQAQGVAAAEVRIGRLYVSPDGTHSPAVG
jgi:polynucleotide 5'-hydroxyl-kinase GRC3/NOL9